MEQFKAITMQEQEQIWRAEEAQEKHIMEIEKMEGKTIKELSLNQSQYLFDNHKKLYMSLVNDNKTVIKDLITLEKLKKNERETERKFAAIYQKQKQEMSKEYANDYIDKILKESFKKLNIES